MRLQTKALAKRYAVYILILLAAHIFQNCLPIFPMLGGVRPALLISCAVAIAMFEGEVIGAAAGLIAGALWDTVTVTADGYNALFLMLVCAVCGLLLRVFMRNNIITYLIMNSGITLLYFLSYALFFITARGVSGAGGAVLRYYLPMAVYSLVLTPLWYWLIRRVNRRFSYNYAEI